MLAIHYCLKRENNLVISPNHVVGEEVCNGSTLKTLGTFTRVKTLAAHLPLPCWSGRSCSTLPIVDLAGLTASFAILNVGVTLLDAADSSATLLDAADSDQDQYSEPHTIKGISVF